MHGFLVSRAEAQSQRLEEPSVNVSRIRDASASVTAWDAPMAGVSTLASTASRTPNRRA